MTSFPNQQRTKSTYSLQWNRYRILRPEEDRATFFSRTGFNPAELENGRVLDAGCGMGRYLRVVAETGAQVAGMDVSEAVIAARELTSDFPNVTIARGDLFHPPFPTATFDFIYSLGVLDHTPDPRASFLALVPLLKPGGRISIWVYKRESPMVERIMKAHRAISTRLPLRVVQTMSRLMAPVGGLKRRLMASPYRLVERAGVVLHALTIGVSLHPDPEVRVCDTLDWYAPRYASRHTLEEVIAWFAEAGLVDVKNLTPGQTQFHKGQGNGINITGARPRT